MTTNTKTALTAQLLLDLDLRLGEGPVWNPLDNKLYWVNILLGEVHRYDPASGKHDIYYRGRVTGGLTIQSDGSMLLFQDRCTVALCRDGKVVRNIVEDVPAEREARFNDVIADPAGRAFCGSLDDNKGGGALYRVDLDGSIRPVVEKVGCCNGMGFTPERKGMYFTDSLARTIWFYDYDAASGALSNGRPFLQMGASGPLPDGMTVDARGNVWTALWGGSCVQQYSPAGQLIGQIDVPGASNITSVAFGGKGLSQLFITSASIGDRGKTGPAGGSLFVAQPAIPGVAEFYSRVGL